MKKCHECGETKGLKQIVPDGCDDPTHHHENTMFRSSICYECWFDYCSCGQDEHEVSECLQDETCSNHEKTMSFYENWNYYDYHWKLKKGVVLTLEGDCHS